MILRVGQAVGDDRRVRYLAICQQLVDLGLEANKVLRVQPSDEWQGPSPLHITGLLDRSVRGSSRDRILIVTSLCGDYALRAGREMRLRAFHYSNLLTIPDLIWADPNRAELVKGIIFERNERPLLVLDPDTVGEVATGAGSSSRGGGVT